jgi:hypothetical protein
VVDGIRQHPLMFGFDIRLFLGTLDQITLENDVGSHVDLHLV